MSFDFNVAYSSRWGYSLINTLKSKQEKERWLEEASTMHDWVVWCKSKKGAEEIRPFQLSGKEIFSNHDETKSKEEKNKKNGSKKKAHRGQSVRYRSCWKQGNIKMAVSEDHASCWVHKDHTVKTKQIQALLTAAKASGKKTSSSLIMWHRYAKRSIGWLCPSSSRCKEVRGQPQRDRGRTSGTMCTCEEIERETHAQRASKLGPVERWWTQDGKLGITIQDPPPESGRRTHLLYFTYSFCILSCVWKLATTLLVLRYYGHLFLFSMLILHVTSSRVCLYLLNICHFTYTFSHAHTEAHTHKHTCTIRNTRGMETTRHRSLVERGGRKALSETLHTHTHKKEKKIRNKTDIHESKRKYSST